MGVPAGLALADGAVLFGSVSPASFLLGLVFSVPSALVWLVLLPSFRPTRDSRRALAWTSVLYLAAGAVVASLSLAWGWLGPGEGLWAAVLIALQWPGALVWLRICTEGFVCA